MTRSIGFGPLLLLGFALSALAQEPKAKPLNQQTSLAEITKKVDDLQKKINDLRAADKYEEALVPAEQLLELRVEIQGKDHSQAVDQKWLVDSFRKISRLPAEKRFAWRAAEKSTEQADSLAGRGRNAEAQLLWETYLKQCLEVFGEEHPYTAAGYNQVAFNLHVQGYPAKAAPLFRKALEIRIKALGEEHPETGASFSNVAFSFLAAGKAAQAEPLLRKALNIRVKSLGEEHPSSGEGCNNFRPPDMGLAIPLILQDFLQESDKNNERFFERKSWPGVIVL